MSNVVQHKTSISKLITNRSIFIKRQSSKLLCTPKFLRQTSSNVTSNDPPINCQLISPQFLLFPVSRRTAIRRLAFRRRVTPGKRGRGVTSDSSVARLWPSRLGSSRGWRVGRTTPRLGSLPESEQEGRQRTEIRQVRSSSVGNQRDAPGGRCHPGQHLPDRVATAQETILTEDRAARQAL